MLLRVLLVMRHRPLRQRVQRLLTEMDVVVSVEGASGELWDRLEHRNEDLVVLDRELVPEPAAKTVAQIRELPDRPEVIVLATAPDPGDQARLLAAGCLAILDRRLDDGLLGRALTALLGRRNESQVLRFGAGRDEAEPRLTDFVSDSPVMQAFVDMARRVVRTDSTLLLLGETGVGKERLARAIHHESPRAGGPFIAVNCGGLPETLLESELFGHEEGAFTGATRPRRGYFELAHRGTLFLDEVGEMPAHLQVKLLRVLQEYEIRRVGSEKPISVDVRVMAATNRDLEVDVESGRFRRDLYFRLAVVTLTLPALRERPEDIPALVVHYGNRFATRFGNDVGGVSENAMRALVAYDWPGNVRELINVVERAVLLCRGTEIDLGDLPPGIAGTAERAVETPPPPPEPVESHDALFELPWADARALVVDTFEREYLAELLRRTRGRIAETAELAGMQPRSLFEKMRRHGLRKEDFKRPLR